MRAYIQGGRQALKDFPLTHVEDPWLHITIDQITDHPAAAIPQDERDALADALTTALSGEVVAFTGSTGCGVVRGGRGGRVRRRNMRVTIGAMAHHPARAEASASCVGCGVPARRCS